MIDTAGEDKSLEDPSILVSPVISRRPTPEFQSRTDGSVVRCRQDSLTVFLPSPYSQWTYPLCRTSSPYPHYPRPFSLVSKGPSVLYWGLLLGIYV